jgi:hypothetical protein
MEEKQIPSLLLNILFSQVDEIMGHRSLILLLRQAGLTTYVDYTPPLDDSPSITVSEYSNLLATMYRVFGSQGARPILVSHGRLGITELWRQRPTQFAVSSVALKLLPTAKRMQIVLDRFADQGEELYDASFHIVEESDAFLLEIGDCPDCAGIIRAGITRAGMNLGRADRYKPVTKPVCHVTAASLEEMIQWATAQPHLVEEIACTAMGDPVCRFRISK